MKLILFFLSNCFILTGCAEKKTRLWIEPPIGSEVSEKTSQKLYYQVEDVSSGKKENLIIPLRQIPENLIVQGRKGKSGEEVDFAIATKADHQISEGKLPPGTNANNPSVSYLRGLAEVETLYQKKQYSEGLVRLGPLIEQYPRQARLFTMQGTLFRKIGEKKMALEAYKRAQQLDKNDPAVEEAVLKSQDELGENL